MRFLLMSASALLAAGPSAAMTEASSSAAADAPADASMPVIDPRGGSDAANCPPISRYHAQKQGGALDSRKLGELPDADMYLSVYRRTGGCIDPMIVRYGMVGGR